MFVRVFASVFLLAALFGSTPLVLAQDGTLPNTSQPTEADGAPVFLMLTEQNPPFNYTNHETGAIVGASVELVHEIMRRAGFQYEIRVMPWRRAFNQAQGKANVCVFSMNHTAARAPLFKWVKPLYRGGFVIYTRVDDQRLYQSEADIKGTVLLARNAEATFEALTTLPGVDILKVESDLEGFQLLARGRGDLLMTGKLISQSILLRAGLQDEYRLAYVWREAAVSIGCSTATDDALMQRLREVNKDLGAFREEVLTRYWTGQ